MLRPNLHPGLPEHREDLGDDESIDPEAAKVVANSEFESIIMDSNPATFDTAQLMQVLTAPYIADAGGGVVALDPNALKKLFTTTRTLLGRMEREVEGQTLELQGDCAPIEAEYRTALTAHTDKLDYVMDDLDGVDKRFREVAQHAVRIGERVGKLEAQRRRAAEALELLGYFKMFEKLPKRFGEDQASVARYAKNLPPLFSDEDRRAEAAEVLAKLKAITCDLDAPELDVAVQNMQAYSDYLEQELLELFERAAGRGRPEVEFMQASPKSECARILHTLNEGEHLQGRYVFFVVSGKLQQPVGDRAAGEGGYDSLSGLFGRVVNVCSQEFALIGKLFPPSLVPKVTRLLLQRILNDPVYGIQARVENVLSPPAPIEPLPLPDYLNCLSMVEQQTMALFEMLKSQDLLQDEVPKQSQDGDSSDDEGEYHGMGQGAALRRYLDDQAKHMFFEHRQVYPQMELRNLLQSLLGITQSAWQGALVMSMVSSHNSVLNSLDDFPTVDEGAVHDMEYLLSGPLRGGLLQDVMSTSRDTVHRCRVILHGDEEAREAKVVQYWGVTCRHLVEHLIFPALRAAHNLLPKPSANAASAALKEIQGGAVPLPTPTFYGVIKAAGTASTAIQAHYKQSIAPGMEGVPTLRTIAKETRRSSVTKIERTAMKVLERALELVVVYTERQLGQRRTKGDYCPKEDQAQQVETTRTVKTICNMLSEQHRVATECLPSMDLRTTWSYVGLRVHELFVSHLKHSRVNVLGAFVLTNDVNTLQSVLGSFGCPKTNAAMEQLREAINLFLVPPENLPGLMETGRLAQMNRDELRHFITGRADYHSHPGIKAPWVKEILGDEPPSIMERKMEQYKERWR
ncbi:unnamed protein product [Chrysoparadoxa australica]